MTRQDVEKWATVQFTDPAQLKGAMGMLDKLWPLVDAATVTSKDLCAHPNVTIQSGRDFCPNCSKFIYDKASPDPLKKAVSDLEGSLA